MILCDYGCNKEAKFKLKNGKNCCNKLHMQCKEVRRKISNSLKKRSRQDIIKNKSCQFCDKKLTKQNFKVHTKSCYLNPKNIKKCILCDKFIPHTNEKFCSQKCANIHRGKIQSGSNHPNWKKEKDLIDYRIICFRHYEKKCIICGFDSVVDVHHIDENNKNNSIDNLIPLCKNHHGMIHMKKFKQQIINEIESITQR